MADAKAMSQCFAKTKFHDLKLILANPKLPEDVRNIWTQHLNNLSVNEEEYNKKVKQIYSLLKPKFRGRGF